MITLLQCSNYIIDFSVTFALIMPKNNSLYLNHQPKGTDHGIVWITALNGIWLYVAVMIHA